MYYGYTYNCHVPNAERRPECPGWWPSPTSSASPSSSSCPAACPIYFHSSPWTDLFCRPFHTHAHHHPPWHTTPRGSTFFVSFQTEPSPRPHRVISRKKSCAFHLVPALPRSSWTPSFGIDLVWLLTALLWFVRDRSRDRLLNYSTVEREEWLSEAGRDNDGREATKESFTESYSDLESHGIHRQVAHVPS